MKNNADTGCPHYLKNLFFFKFLAYSYNLTIDKPISCPSDVSTSAKILFYSPFDSSLKKLQELLYFRCRSEGHDSRVCQKTGN